MIPDGPVPDVPETPRTTPRLLVDRTVGGYVLANLFGAMGSWIHNIVAAIVVYDVTGSALLVGLVSVVQFVPQMALSPWMGAMADRGDRRRQVIVGRLLIAAGSGGLGAWLWLVDDRGVTAAVVIIVAGAVVGLGFATSIPAMQSIVPALAPPVDLAAVVALSTSPLTLARAAGPATGAFLLVALGPAAAFAAAALGQSLFALAMWHLRLRPVHRSATAGDSVLDGFRYVRRNRGVALLLLGITGVGFGVDPVITLTPPLAENFGGGADLVAIMASAFGVGAASLLLLLGRLRRRVGQDMIGFGGLCLLALSMVLVAASPTSMLAVASFFLGGLGMMAAVTGMTTQLHELVLEDYRGRVMALWAVAFVGSRPIAAILNGLIADVASADVALVVLAIVLAGAALQVRPSRLASAARTTRDDHAKVQ